MNLKRRIEEYELYTSSICEADSSAEKIMRYIAPMTGLSEDDVVKIWIEKCHRRPFTLGCGVDLLKGIEERKEELGIGGPIGWPEGLSQDASHEEIRERFKSELAKKNASSNPPDS